MASLERTLPEATVTWTKHPGSRIGILRRKRGERDEPEPRRPEGAMILVADGDLMLFWRGQGRWCFCVNVGVSR